MPVSINNTQVVFNDATTQTTAFAGGVINQGISSYNSPGTFTTPANTTKVWIALTGGSGANGGQGANSGGGGGAGAVAAGFYPVTASTPYPITVGAAGNAPGSPNAAGNAGTASSFGSILTSNGGGGGGAGPGSPEGPSGSGGAQGNAPLGQVVVGAGGVQTQAWSNDAGTQPGGQSGVPGKAGRVVVYY
jgi:hypothetical protein